jgi:plastocyanin
MGPHEIILGRCLLEGRCKKYMEDENINAAQTEPSKQNNNKMTMGMIIVVIVVIAVIGGYFLLANRKTSSPTVENQNNQGEMMQDDGSAMSPEESMESTDSAMMEGEGMTEGMTKSITVEGSEYSYTPSTLNANVGDIITLTFKNTGTYSHNLVIPDLNVQTKTINPGESDTIEFTADKAGTYSFYCTVDSHKDKGMVGTLNVQ